MSRFAGGGATRWFADDVLAAARALRHDRQEEAEPSREIGGRELLCAKRFIKNVLETALNGELLSIWVM